MEGDVMDFLIQDWKDDPERNRVFRSGDRILLSPYFIMVVLDLNFYGEESTVFNVEWAVKEFKSYIRYVEDFLTAQFVMMPLFKPIVLAKDKTSPHYSLYVMNRYRITIDILDSLPYQKKRRASSKSTYHKHCELIFTRLVQVLKAVYNASKQPNWAIMAKRPRYVALPLQGENECGNYAMKYAATYDGEKFVEDIQDQDPRVVYNCSP